MSDENKVVIVKHHIITEEVRPISSQQKEGKEVVKVNKDDDKWCWTRIQEAKERNANDTKKCWSEVLQILLESCGVIVVFIFENLFGIIFLILGIVYLNDCPIQRGIPISLIVYGVMSIIHGITIQLVRWKYINLDQKGDGFATCAGLIILITTIVHMIALFIACFLVFHIHKKVQTSEEQKGTDQYCHPFLYWFAFWFFVFMAILGFILVLIFVCLCCFILSGADTPHSHYVVIHSPGKSRDVSDSVTANQSAATAQQQNVGNQTSTAPPTPQ